MKILTNRRNKNAVRGPRTKMQKSSTYHLLMATSQTLTQNVPEVLNTKHKLYQR